MKSKDFPKKINSFFFRTSGKNSRIKDIFKTRCSSRDIDTLSHFLSLFSTVLGIILRNS